MLIKHLQKFTLATVGVLIRTKKWGGCMYQEGRWEAWPRPAVLFWARLHAGTLWSDLEVLEGPGGASPVPEPAHACRRRKSQS